MPVARPHFLHGSQHRLQARVLYLSAVNSVKQGSLQPSISAAPSPPQPICSPCTFPAFPFAQSSTNFLSCLLVSQPLLLEDYLFCFQSHLENLAKYNKGSRLHLPARKPKLCRVYTLFHRQVSSNPWYPIPIFVSHHHKTPKVL